MHVNKTRAVAGAALMSALSVICLCAGTFIPVNTLFFTALASFLVGFSLNRYGFRVGGVQLAACVTLDAVLNPDKANWVLFLFLGGYLFLSELIFQKANRIVEIRKKMRIQLALNWILFNVIYIPLILCFQTLLVPDGLPSELSANETVGRLILWAAGQLGWFVYDKAYRVFFRMLRERRNVI